VFPPNLFLPAFFALAQRRFMLKASGSALSPVVLDRKALGYTTLFMAERRPECSRKMALLGDVRAAMGALMSIHNDEVTALLNEDFDRITELRTKLKAAREHKASLIELYREHVISHGC
jgi:hypothetical protein